MQQLEVTAASGLNVRRYPAGDAHIFVAMPFGMRIQRIDMVVWRDDWIHVRARFSDSYVAEGYAHKAHLRPVARAVEPADEVEAAPRLHAWTDDTVRRRFLDELHPDFRKRILQLLEKSAEKGLPIHLSEAYRTPSRQRALHARNSAEHGAEAAGEDAWESPMNFGLAATLAFPAETAPETRTKTRDQLNSFAPSFELTLHTSGEPGEPEIEARIAGWNLEHTRTHGRPHAEGRTWKDNLVRMAERFPEGAPEFLLEESRTDAAAHDSDAALTVADSDTVLPEDDDSATPVLPDGPEIPDLGAKQLFADFKLAEQHWDSERWPNFKPSEFRCRHCDQYMHDPEFLDALSRLRKEWGRGLKVNSGTRCLQHNKKIGGSKKSYHLPPNVAADISIRGMEGDEPIQLLHAARRLGFNGCGRGNTFLHLDRRPQKWTSWWYNKPQHSSLTWKRFLEAHTARTGRTFIEPDDCPPNRRNQWPA